MPVNKAKPLLKRRERLGSGFGSRAGPANMPHPDAEVHILTCLTVLLRLQENTNPHTAIEWPATDLSQFSLKSIWGNRWESHAPSACNYLSGFLSYTSSHKLISTSGPQKFFSFLGSRDLDGLPSASSPTIQMNDVSLSNKFISWTFWWSCTMGIKVAP